MYELSTSIKTFERRSIWYIWFWSILKNGVKPVSVQTEKTLEEKWVISWETKTSGDLECIKVWITEQTEPCWDTEHNKPVGSILLSQIIMCGIATKWNRFKKTRERDALLSLKMETVFSFETSTHHIRRCYSQNCRPGQRQAHKHTKWNNFVQRN